MSFWTYDDYRWSHYHYNSNGDWVPNWSHPNGYYLRFWVSNPFFHFLRNGGDGGNDGGRPIESKHGVAYSTLTLDSDNKGFSQWYSPTMPMQKGCSGAGFNAVLAVNQAIPKQETELFPRNGYPNNGSHDSNAGSYKLNHTLQTNLYTPRLAHCGFCQSSTPGRGGYCKYSYQNGVNSGIDNIETFETFGGFGGGGHATIILDLAIKHMDDCHLRGGAGYTSVHLFNEIREPYGNGGGGGYNGGGGSGYWLQCTNATQSDTNYTVNNQGSVGTYQLQSQSAPMPTWPSNNDVFSSKQCPSLQLPAPPFGKGST